MNRREVIAAQATLMKLARIFLQHPDATFTGAQVARIIATVKFTRRR